MSDLEDKITTEVRNELAIASIETLTEKALRRKVEQTLGLDLKALDQPPFKAQIAALVLDFLTARDSPSKEPQSVISRDSPSKEPQPEPVQEADDQENDLTLAIPRRRKRVSAMVDSDEEEEEEEEEAQEGEVAEARPVSKKGAGKHDASNVEEEVAAEDADAPRSPPKKKVAKKPAQDIPISEAHRKKIESLQVYIRACGVRKVWSKEFAGMSGLQRIQRCKEILVELGVDARPTLEKCKKIKLKREFQEEVGRQEIKDKGRRRADGKV
ncbi:hypothetical protein BDK51DRAFT_28761 [Blyttiomyces helicus]|uniref:DEK-C domain-containing protein n=1 Tax=Blyttiomyces helicus TaxID=388810 RepID=A0A4P9WRN4_9FUNG|nr:hypothetical protein BDK51DRAFT_28761 [Blyttiomyces helicus]|eukprot:RKO93950.1 hypothetical protein BDK51DRAFT_28761 [Blyttiomyces helicus]